MGSQLLSTPETSLCFPFSLPSHVQKGHSFSGKIPAEQTYPKPQEINTKKPHFAPHIGTSELGLLTRLHLFPQNKLNRKTKTQSRDSGWDEEHFGLENRGLQEKWGWLPGRTAGEGRGHRHLHQSGEAVIYTQWYKPRYITWKEHTECMELPTSGQTGTVVLNKTLGVAVGVWHWPI